MTELLLIRHGETDFNRQWRFQGQVDVPLNATGHAQAQRLARRLAGEPVELLLSSDLQRARQTAEPLAARLGHGPLLVPALREQAFGIVEGLTAAEIQTHHPAAWESWLRHDADLAVPGGESTRAFHARVMQALGELAAERPGARLVVVTHGGVLDMVWRTVHGLPLAGPRTCAIPNTGLNRLRWRVGGPEIVAWGDDAHVAAG